MMIDQNNYTGLTPEVVSRLRDLLKERYHSFTKELPFHGWHHVEFVRARAISHSRKNGSNTLVVEAAALLHDINYMVERNSRAHQGEDLRRQILEELGVSAQDTQWIERVIREAEIEARSAKASLEAQALSDADTIFKALPVTPILLANLYMQETGRTLRELCDHIISHQVPLFERGIYFYDADTRAQYQEWACINLRLWQCIDEALNDPAVQKIVEVMEANLMDKA
jgi:uncharacterized protein